MSASVILRESDDRNPSNTLPPVLKANLEAIVEIGTAKTFLTIRVSIGNLEKLSFY